MVVFEFHASDIYFGALGGVDGGKKYIGRICTTAHYKTARRQHIGIEFVHSEIAGVDLAEKRRQDFSFGIEDVVLQFREKCDSCDNRLMVEAALFPQLRSERSLACHMVGGERVCYVGTLYAIGYQCRNRLTIFSDTLPQKPTSVRSGSQHYHSGAFEIITVADVVHVAIVAIGLSHYQLL